MDTLTKQIRQLRLYVGVLTVIVLVCLIAIVLVSGIMPVGPSTS